MTRLLWLLVAYNNMQEVDHYIDLLEALPGGSSFGYSICDNSARVEHSRHLGSERLCFTNRPDNPGYLEGALVALAAWRESGRDRPDWVAISNTDLVPMTHNLLGELEGYGTAAPVLVAPRITEGSQSTEKNPHLMTRRSLRRLRANAFVARSVLGVLAYQAVRVAALKISQNRGASRHDSDQWASDHPAGQKFYSPYGAIMFFSKDFSFDGVCRDAPLLSEEYFLAEAADTQGAAVLYAPSIHFHHNPHATTGPKIGASRARRTAVAFREIYDHAKARDRR